MLEKANRKVKLQSKHKQLYCGEMKIVPDLRVNGVWLEQHGFKTGSQVAFVARLNELIIKPR
jgi:hypothetical protein